jgi:hypothetical protein
MTTGTVRNHFESAWLATAGCVKRATICVVLVALSCHSTPARDGPSGGVIVHAEPRNNTGRCPVLLRFTATIGFERATQVQYYWEHGDGSTSAVVTGATGDDGNLVVTDQFSVGQADRSFAVTDRLHLRFGAGAWFSTQAAESHGTCEK